MNSLIAECRRVGPPKRDFTSLAKLVAAGLAEETPVTNPNIAWRTEAGRHFGVVLTEAGKQFPRLCGHPSKDWTLDYGLSLAEILVEVSLQRERGRLIKSRRKAVIKFVEGRRPALLESDAFEREVESLRKALWPARPEDGWRRNAAVDVSLTDYVSQHGPIPAEPLPAD